LAHNPAYRNCITTQGYRQQHIPDYYLGDGMTTPPTPDILLAGTKFNPADIVEDGHIDFIDFAVLTAQWNKPPSIPSSDIDSANGDGTVDYQDLMVLCDNWLAAE
jgi:hypothetical protein